ncbi:MAG: hypothetical protein IKN42_07985 [Elusimicrobia bacterium]|nr:hypothetical protein [Elusimicrobiota bacterium]
MEGTSLEELYELIANQHDAEFTYKSEDYVLQLESKDGKSYLVIWENSDTHDNRCLCRYETPSFHDIPKKIIDAVLSEKCFDGKSFLEIEKDITVTCIF